MFLFVSRFCRFVSFFVCVFCLGFIQVYLGLSRFLQLLFQAPAVFSGSMYQARFRRLTQKKRPRSPENRRKTQENHEKSQMPEATGAFISPPPLTPITLRWAHFPIFNSPRCHGPCSQNRKGEAQVRVSPGALLSSSMNMDCDSIRNSKLGNGDGNSELREQYKTNEQQYNYLYKSIQQR